MKASAFSYAQSISVAGARRHEYRTPGMPVAAQDMRTQNPGPRRKEIRGHLFGNHFRYQTIAEATARARLGHAS
jgi:aerobic-type carbon monoxide dehydrogenase small subunit (CoxS/CutS family)